MKLEEAPKEPINNKETKDEIIQEAIKSNNLKWKEPNQPLKVKSKFPSSTYEPPLPL